MSRQLGTLAIALAAGMMATSADAFWGSHGGSYGGRSYGGGSYGGGSYGGRSHGGGSYGSGSYGGSYVSSGSHGSYGGGPIRRLASRIHARHASHGSYGSYGGGSYGGSNGGSSYGGSSYGGGSYGGGSYGGGSYVTSYSSSSCGSHGGSYSSPVYETYDSGYYESTPVQQPTPADSGASIDTDAGLLRVEVPADATVYVNGKLTTSEGTERQFVSYGLVPGKDYNYDVRVEFVADGRTVSESRQVTLTAGGEELLAFATPAASVETIATTLELTVPEGAKVRLAGVETKQTGTTRQFVTNRLSAGSTWDNYTVEVEATIDGKIVREAKTISLNAGETRAMAFNFEKAAPQLAMSGN